jgi:putative addiction module CopG family antidote
MTIHLPEDLEHYVRASVGRGRFASEDDVISEAVRLLRENEREQKQLGTSGVKDDGSEPAWKRVLEIMQDLPDSEFDHIPADSSEQLDHYIYGTPKRSRS